MYLNDFLQNQRGLTIEHATTVVFVLKMASLAGQMVGSNLGQLAYNRRSELQPLLMGVSKAFLSLCTSSSIDRISAV